MADYDGLKPGEILADASVAEFISRLGLGIAEAQRALDENSIDQLGEFLAKRDDLGGQSLLELGLLPAFYHYQHADISCSLQLSLKVQKSFGFDLNLKLDTKNETTEGQTGETEESSTESGSSTSTSTRSATIAIKMNSAGVLKVGGTDFTPAGATPAARIADLTDKLRAAPDSGVSRALVTPQTTAVNPTVEPPHDKVIAKPNSVTFLTGGFDSGTIEIGKVPAAPEEFTLNPQVKVTPALPQANNRAYADDLAAKIIAQGFVATAFGSDARVTHCNFDFDKADIRPGDDEKKLRAAAAFLKASGHKVKVFGHTDRSGPPDYNVKLGNRRVDAVVEYLLAQGVDAGQLLKQPSTGEKRATEGGDPDGKKNEEFRLGELILTDTQSAFVSVQGDAGHTLDDDAVAPDRRDDQPKPDNGFIHVYDAVATNLAAGGRKVVIKGQDFPLRGVASGGNPANSPEAYALNLATDVNAAAAVKVKAWPTGNVCNLANEGDAFNLELVTTESREITLAGSEGTTVTSQFTRTKSSKTSTSKTGNTSVAFGASVGIRYARSFEMEVTGNSAISARLVSIPAPPEFLAAIKEFLKP